MPALPDPGPRPECRNRAHVGREVALVHAVGLVEQVERVAQVALGLPDPCHRDPPAMTVLRQRGVLAELLAPEQELSGGSQVVALAVDRTQPDVHVGRSPQRRHASPGFSCNACS